MFNSSRSFVFTLFTLLALSSALAFAAPHKGKEHSGSGAVTHKLTGTTLDAIERRYDNARFTYYDAGENACGGYDSNTDYVIAISPSLYNNGAHCYKSVTVQYNGQQVKAKVTDECPGCNGAEADLSRPLFAHLAPLDEGVLYGQWWFN
ncbi:RlpA-like double-psi beta-barrel-protein domain-containing protein-containing protein [Cerioporus squamosus]|nr:RlpA-like double-psi beta-barrel-protein domain-containing protein-containing protein [Cerioporus squamosus]